MTIPQARPKAIQFAWEVHEPVEVVREEPKVVKLVTVILKCQQCRKSFQKTYKDTDERAQYCSKKCKEAHRVAKNVAPSPAAVAKIAAKPRPCPTPDKKKFPTQYAAQKKALSASRKYVHPVRTYRCACGMWHMTVHRAYNMGA